MVMFATAPLLESVAAQSPTKLDLLLIPKNVLIDDVTKKIHKQTASLDLIGGGVIHRFGIFDGQVTLAKTFTSSQYIVSE
jgi:hypothetical protein